MLVTQEVAEVEKKEVRLNKWLMTALVVLAVHVGLVVVTLLVSVIVSAQHEPEIIATVIAPVQEEKESIQKKEVKKQAEQAVAQVSAPPIAELLRANTTAMVTAPKMMTMPDTPIGLGEGNLSVGFSKSGGSMGRGAVFFGAKVQGRLGVVFDVSGSMHEYVPLVVDEINAKFRTAMVVCVNSAVMKETSGDPQAVRYLDANNQNSRKPLLFTDVARKMDEDLAGLPNCYFIHTDDNTLGAGVEWLMNENVNNIFIFSDFQDSYDGKYIEALTANAVQGKAKIHLHVLDELGAFNMGREPYIQGLARKSGGVYAVGELLKRAR